MKPATVILGVLALGIIWPWLSKGSKGKETPLTDDAHPTLEQTIESNVRVLAESVREANRLDRLFRNVR